MAVSNINSILKYYIFAWEYSDSLDSEKVTEKQLLERKLKMNSTQGVVIIDPFSGNLILNLIATFFAFMIVACSTFLIWFSNLERSNTFSQFRPVTQQLTSFAFFQVSILLIYFHYRAVEMKQCTFNPI